VANQRKRNKAIASLENNGVLIEDKNGMIDHALEFYKNLFGEEKRDDICLSEDFWEDDERVTVEENEALEAKFSEEGIRRVVFESYAEGALGPDGIYFMFYQKLWAVIKNDLMALVREFEKGRVNLARLNYALITLIPKEEGGKCLEKIQAH
jgi:hypothetical protein